MIIQDKCPRCSKAFHCGSKDPQPCACCSFKLSEATLLRLRQQFTGCLCMACLQELQAMDEREPDA